MRRRDFLKASAAIGTAAFTGTLWRTARAADLASRDKLPNIVFAIADDWSYPHASGYGDPVVKTPSFDRVAREGALFTHSFCIAPTCTASRGGILTGQPPHRLGAAGNLWSVLPANFPVYTDMLEAVGYAVGLTGKGWGPGSLGERKFNPAGRGFKTFEQFLASAKGKPFCYWFGSQDPHRPYDRAFGKQSGIKREDVRVPAFLPDAPAVRDDLIDYYAEVQRYDSNVGNLLKVLDDQKLAGNTIVVVTSDNGLPFPRAKTNLYDSGTRMPLAIRYPARVKAGQKLDALVSHLDFAPTFLELAELKSTPEMAGMSLLPLLEGKPQDRPRIFTERERHANSRAGNIGYPVRAIRTRDHMYIRNFFPDRTPAGDEDFNGSQGRFGDIDSGPSKQYVIENRNDPRVAPFFRMCCAKRPAQELYDLTKDPDELKNIAGHPNYADVQARLRRELESWMAATADPRAKDPTTDVFDRYTYVTGATTRPGRR